MDAPSFPGLEFTISNVSGAKAKTPYVPWMVCEFDFLMDVLDWYSELSGPSLLREPIRDFLRTEMQEKDCYGLATIFKGNTRYVGNPDKHGAWGDLISNNSTAIIPRQWGFGRDKDLMQPFIARISGQIFLGSLVGWEPLFSDVRDRADDRGERRRHGWSLKQFENDRIQKARNFNGGNLALYLEIPGIPSQINSAWVRITIPGSLSCPEETKEGKK